MDDFHLSTPSSLCLVAISRRPVGGSRQTGTLGTCGVQEHVPVCKRSASKASYRASSGATPFGAVQRYSGKRALTRDLGRPGDGGRRRVCASRWPCLPAPPGPPGPPTPPPPLFPPWPRATPSHRGYPPPPPRGGARGGLRVAPPPAPPQTRGPST